MNKTPEQDAADRAAAKARKRAKHGNKPSNGRVGRSLVSGLEHYLNQNPEKAAAAGLCKDPNKNR